jgi:PAS domain S-box-containing protein
LSSSIMELRKIGKKYERVDRNSLFLLLLLTIPAGVMVLVLLLWPDLRWVAEIPHTAIELLGSFAAVLLSVFLIARYREETGILYVSAGLLSMGIIEGFHSITLIPSNESVWLHSFAGICGGVFFILYVLSEMTNLGVPSIKATAKGVGWLLGGTATFAFLLGILSIVLADMLPVMMRGENFTTLAGVVNTIPVVLYLFAGINLFRQYRKTGAHELFLFTAILIFLFQAAEVSYFVSLWSIIWWLWQALRLVVYLAILGYVLKEYIQTSDSLVIEVDERKKVEKSLRKATQDWRDSFNSLEEAMFIIDRAYNIENVNNSGLALLGKSKQEVIGEKCYQVVHGNGQPTEYCPFKQTIKSKKAISIERYDEAFGRHFSITSAPMFDEHRRVSKCVYLMRDITEAVEAKEKERELQQELNITSRLASIGEVAAGIAHEINNPLTGVIGFAQMLTQMDVPEDIKEAVEVIDDGAKRTAGIVEKLLTFARRNKPEKEYVDINSILMSAIDIRAYEMRINNIEVTTDLVLDLPRTMANVGQLQQVFLNIIINAEHAMAAHEGGTLSIKTERVNGNVRVSIGDDGPGISKENIGKLFDPFFTTKDSDEGTGLGLSISYGIIKEHGGIIRVESKLGKGTTFIIDLPVLTEVEKTEVDEASKQGTENVTGAKILVVDDEPNICRVLDRLLTREGHNVETMSCAQMALEKLNGTKYDLILLDIKMPGMNGIEFYNHLKDIAPSLQRKVVCITGDVISAKNKAFLEKAKIPCITKPFAVDELIHRVKLGLGGKVDNEKANYSNR